MIQQDSQAAKGGLPDYVEGEEGEGRLYYCVVLPSSSSSFLTEWPPRPLPLPGPLSLGPNPDFGEREVAGVLRFWRLGRPDGETELAVE